MLLISGTEKAYRNGNISKRQKDKLKAGEITHTKAGMLLKVWG